MVVKCQILKNAQNVIPKHCGIEPKPKITVVHVVGGLEMSKIFLDNHHPDKINRPSYTIPTLHKKHQKIHDTLPIDTPLSRKMREYDKVNTILVTMKN